MKITFSSMLSTFVVHAPEGTLVSLSATPTEIGDGVYAVGDSGMVLVDEEYQTDTIYLSTEGEDYTVEAGERICYPAEDIVVWGGNAPDRSPFKVSAKGGGGSGGDNTHYKGTTTTAISNGSTTNPITIDGESYTAVFGDIVVYNYTEFVFDGTTWSEFGRPFDTTPTSGSANAVTSDGIKTALDTKQNIMQYATMPTITASMLGKVVQYVGTSDSNYKQGWNYVAVSDGAAEPTYSWRALMDNTPTSGSANAVTSGGVYQRTPWTRGTGNNSACIGQSSFASGANSVSAGFANQTSAEETAAFGYGLSANRPYMFACGKHNTTSNGDLFTIGNGTANARSNIVEVNYTSMNVNGDIMRDGVGIDDYTTTERKIGKWIDGSDLYQRTFEVTGLSINTWNNSILGTSDIKIVDFTGLIYWLENLEVSDTTQLNYYASGSDNCFTCVNTAQTDMRIYPVNTSSSMSISKAVITIKYTKPSAQANTLNANIQQTEEPTDEMR